MLRRRPHALIWPTLAMLVVLAVFGVLVAVMIRAISPAAAGHDSKYVIPAGRESVVMTFLAEDAKSFAGIPIGDIRLEGDSIFLHLENKTAGCDGPAARISPAQPADSSVHVASAADLWVSWATCQVPEDAANAAGERLAKHLAGRPHDNIWSWVAGHAPGGIGGILAPFARSFPSSPSRTLGWIFAAATLLSLLAGATSAPADEPHSDATPRGRRLLSVGVLVTITILGIALRARAAAHLPFDIDEAYARPSPHSIVTNDHDALIHPPLHRAIQRAWVTAIHWHDGDTLFRLRVPSLIASIVALLALALRVGSWSSLSARTALIGVAVAPVVVDSSVLARPYAFATLGVVLTLVSVFSRPGRSPTRVAWVVALLGVAVAVWSDLIAGVAAVTLLSLGVGRMILREGLRCSTPASLALFAAFVFCQPLVPGAREALQQQVRPEPAQDGSPSPDLSPSRGMGAGQISGLVPAVARFGTIGAEPGGGTASNAACVLILVVGLGVVGVVGRRARDLAFSLAPAVLFALCIVAGTKVALRPRNILFLPHAMSLFGASALAAVAARRRETEELAAAKNTVEHSE